MDLSEVFKPAVKVEFGHSDSFEEKEILNKLKRIFGTVGEREIDEWMYDETMIRLFSTGYDTIEIRGIKACRKFANENDVQNNPIVNGKRYNVVRVKEKVMTAKERAERNFALYGIADDEFIDPDSME